MNNIYITSYDIARFLYDRDITITKTDKIIDEIWRSKQQYLKISVYEDKQQFESKVRSILDYMLFGEYLSEEAQSIKSVNKDLQLDCKLNYEEIACNADIKTSQILYLKQIKLILDFDCNKDYMSIKLRTILKRYGYKRRSNAFITQLNMDLERAGLYVTFQEKKCLDFKGVTLDNRIRLYANN